MNIWYFCLDPRPSSRNKQYAPSIHIMETISALQAQGHSVHHFLYGDSIKQAESIMRQTSQKLDQKNFLFRVIKPLLRDVYELYQNTQDKSFVKPIFQNNSIDVVYERLFHNKSTVSAYAQEYDVPLIVESNSPTGERIQYWGAPLSFITNYLEKKVLQRADAVIVVSTSLKKYYEKSGIHSEKIFVLPNGINEKRFAPETVSRNVRIELGLNDKVVLGFVGNIHTYHGIELFLPLARTFSSSKDNVHFLVVGGGPGRKDLHNILGFDNLDKFFTFIDPVPNSEIPNYIAAMDICLLPQFMWYGSPMKIFEYGAMGKAIIAPDLENIRDVLTHSETAFLFEPGDIAALTQAIQVLVNDTQLRVRLGNSVQQHILKNHTWAKNAERIIEIYNKITS